jgi:hypothetical protein
MVVLIYWAVIVLMAAFFLRQACSLCRANMPSWKRAIISVLLVTFLAYLIFDFTAYIEMRTLDGVALVIPPGYGYHIWFREPLGLKWLIISQLGPLKYLPIVFAICGAGILQVFVLEAEVTFGWGLFIVGLQTLATFIGAYVVSLVLTSVLQSTGWTIQGEPVTTAANPQPPPDERAAGGRVRENRAKNKTVAAAPKQKGKTGKQAAQEPAAGTEPEKETASLELVKKEASDAAETTSEYAKTAAKNLKDYGDSFLEHLEDDLAPVTKHLPESVQNFLAKGGWWGVIGVCAFIVVLWLRAIVHRFSRNFFKRRRPKKKKGRKKGSGPNLKENLGWIGKGFTDEGPEQFTVKGIPARLRLVILSMGNRTTGELSEEMSDRVLDWIKPGSAHIASFDQPAVRVWPPFYSFDGFASSLGANVPLPEPPGMKSQWVLVAGRVKMGRVTINVGMALSASEPNSLRLVKVRGENWLSVLGITETAALARAR